MKVVILVIMLYLVSVCSAEPRIWTAVNGNEVEAEFDCKIVEILVKDGDPVEYDMPIFVVEKV